MIRVPGFRFAGVRAGIKKKELPDLALAAAEGPVAAAGVFTRNRVRAAPVVLSEANLKRGRARGIVVNSGNANACTGARGAADAKAMATAAAAALAAPAGQICVASTGVIGVPLPMEKVTAGIARAAAALSQDGFADFAQAILTTDRGPKVHVVRTRIARQSVIIAGCAKGAGMIGPNMATTLGFVFTDAAADPAWLRATLRTGAGGSFNSVTVDGDTSTNDSLFVLASGASGGAVVKRDDANGKKLAAGIGEVLLALAKMLVRDGEGATKLVTIRVEGARHAADAEAVARRIALSPLVKTAFFGSDPNWGRILCAAGNAGVPFDPARIDVDLGDVPVVRRGMGVNAADTESRAHAVMSREEWTMRVNLHQGRASAVHHTCDLGHAYVSVNADYRS